MVIFAMLSLERVRVVLERNSQSKLGGSSHGPYVVTMDGGPQLCLLVYKPHELVCDIYYIP